MLTVRWTSAATVWFLALFVLPAQAAAPADPLFRSNEILNVRIVAPMSTLLSTRPVEEQLPATLAFRNSAGQQTQLDVQIRTRGRYRRQKEVCRFPPLRLNFKKKQTEATLFHQQDKIKLVTHCQIDKNFEQVLLREYMAYRILNVLTDTSFRVRLFRITYVDSEQRHEDLEKYGFVIEHRERLGKRLQKEVVATTSTRMETLEPGFANLMSVYHYLIGNTDYSQVAGTKAEFCCHNHVLFGNENEPYWSVPYDFDQSGLVDAPYAMPSERFRLSSVRRRLYRGRCIHNDQIPASVTAFMDKRDAIEQLILAEAALSDKSRKSLTAYVNKFYKVLEKQKRIKSALIRACI